MDPRLDFPGRARDALLPTATARAGGHAAVLGPLTIRRLALIHSLETPLFYPDTRLGTGLGWLATGYALAEDTDARRLTRLLAERGAGAVADEACDWAEAAFPGADPLRAIMDASRSLWRAACGLDPAPSGDGDAEGPVAPSGESSRPATAPSPSSPAGR